MGSPGLTTSPVVDPPGPKVAEATGAASHRYRPELDGLRSIAVYLVLLFHTGLGWAEGGFIGVDLFFVLSGFLVSSVILSEIDRTGRLQLGRFYARRVRRLLPAAVVVVVATSLTFTVLWSVARRLDIVGDAQSALLYYANWHFLQASGDYFAADVDKSPFLHFWSLAIEEQFYVVFPVLLLVLSRFGRRVMLAALTALLVLSLLAQVYWAQADPTRAYYGTDARLYQLIAGAVLAVALHSSAAVLARRPALLLTTGGLLGLLVLGSGLVTASASVRGIGATVVSTVLIGGLMVHPDQSVGRVLSMRVPVFLGRISYGTYLWHWPVIIALTTLFDTSPLVVAAFALGISTGLAALSYEVLEMPVRKARLLDRVQWGTALVGVGASAVLAVTLVPVVLELERKPQLATAVGGDQAATLAGEAARRPVPTGVDWAKIRHDNGDSHWCPADEPESCTVVEGDGPHLLFVGDSQGVTLVPMFKRLAREHDLTLSLNVLAGCPWQEGLANGRQAPAGAANCEAARVGWYDEALPVLAPDVVILLGRPRDDPAEWADTVARRDGREQPLAQAVFETTMDSLERISAIADKTVIIERLIMPETFEPTDCLASSRTIGQCAVPVPTEPSASDGYIAAAAAQSASILSVSLNDVFCPGAPVCLPMVGRHVVWRDNHHYTAAFAMARREAVWRVLTESGALDLP